MISRRTALVGAAMAAILAAGEILAGDNARSVEFVESVVQAITICPRRPFQLLFTMLLDLFGRKFFGVGKKVCYIVFTNPAENRMEAATRPIANRRE